MSNKLKTLVVFIQAITDQTVEQVAKSVNYSRAWLVTEMNKDTGNPAIEGILREKYRNEMEEFFREKDSLLGDKDEAAGDDKIVDVDQVIVEDNMKIKGMLRVILRNQAAIIAAQTKMPLGAVARQISEAVRVEIQDEFDEL